MKLKERNTFQLYNIVPSLKIMTVVYLQKVLIHLKLRYKGIVWLCPETGYCWC